MTMLRPIVRAARAACSLVLSAALAHAQWQQNGNDLFYDQGRVGVGTAPATASILEVLAGDPDRTKAINASRYSEFGAAIWGTAASDTGPAAGVLGRTHSID